MSDINMGEIDSNIQMYVTGHRYELSQWEKLNVKFNCPDWIDAPERNWTRLSIEIEASDVLIVDRRRPYIWIPDHCWFALGVAFAKNIPIILIGFDDLTDLWGNKVMYADSREQAVTLAYATIMNQRAAIAGARK